MFQRNISVMLCVITFWSLRWACPVHKAIFSSVAWPNQSVVESGKGDRIRILSLSAICLLESDVPVTLQSFKDYVNNSASWWILNPYL